MCFSGSKEERRSHGEEFKARVALEAIKAQKTVNEIASEHGVHPDQISLEKAFNLRGS